MKELKKVLVGIISILILAFVVDRVVGKGLAIFYKSAKYDIFYKQQYCLHDSKEDLLILGSSRASHHYVSQIFQDSLKMSCYNCGSEGMCIYYHYAILSSYIERGNIPKIVVCDLMYTDAQESHTSTFGLDAAVNRLEPHFGEFSEVDSLILSSGWQERIKLASKIYPYNSKLIQLLMCYYVPTPIDNGYSGLDGKMNDSDDFISDGYCVFDIEKNKLDYYNKMIDICQNNDIFLILVQSPYYGNSGSLGIDTLKIIANERNIPWLDYFNKTEFMEPSLFRDRSHLNDYGAHLFSSSIANEIKSLLNFKLNRNLDAL